MKQEEIDRTLENDYVDDKEMLRAPLLPNDIWKQLKRAAEVPEGWSIEMMAITLKSGADVINKFYCSITTLCWNKAI